MLLDDGLGDLERLEELEEERLVDRAGLEDRDAGLEERDAGLEDRDEGLKNGDEERLGDGLGDVFL